MRLSANFMAGWYVNVIGYRSYRKEMDLQSADHRFLDDKPRKHLYWALERNDGGIHIPAHNLGWLTAVQTTIDATRRIAKADVSCFFLGSFLVAVSMKANRYSKASKCAYHSHGTSGADGVHLMR
jgi:hypothetical protein